MCAGPSTVGRRGTRQCKGNGDAGRATPRLRWGAADGRIDPATDQPSRGVQGSSGPLVGGRRIETAGPLILSVTKEQRCNEKLSKRRPLRSTAKRKGRGEAPANQSRSPLMSLILLKIMLQLHRSTPGSGSMTSLTSCSISAWLAATAWTCSLLQPVTR